MGLFKSIQLFYDVSGYADDVASSLMSTLRYDGYEVDGVKLPSGEWDISVKKGNLFKAVLGLQTALKISISLAAPHMYVAYFGDTHPAISVISTQFVFL